MGRRTPTIGRGLWLDKVASEIVSRENRLGRSLDKVIVESGLGASGIPHVGSIGDAVRAHGIRLALTDLGYDSNLIAYSDDFDGLRRVPEGFPKSLREKIGTPVSMIDDPFGCHDSYGDHMSSILLDGLDRLGIPYKFQSGTEAYRSGLLTPQIEKILAHADEIGARISETLGQDKFVGVLPYYPLCENCKRIYLAQALQYLPGKKRVTYRCTGSQLGGEWIEGCGHEGERSVSDGLGKLSWKSEFAARWSALDVRFEAFGKDIEDSVRINDWISEKILDFPHPSHVRYELFLTRSGKKISKSLGNVFTPQSWLTYGSRESLLLLMYKRIEGTRLLGVEEIPVYMDEIDALEDLYFGKVKIDNVAKGIQQKALYEYIYHLNPPKESSVHVPYRLLAKLSSLANRDNLFSYVEKKLQEYKYIRRLDESLREKIALAKTWMEDMKNQTELVTITEIEKHAIRELIVLLDYEKDPTRIQSEIYEIAKKNGITPSAFFKILYRILISAERGPRLGPYIVDTGVERVSKLLSSKIDDSHM